MRTTDTHVYFWGSALSNFWLAKTRIKIGEELLTFISSEHAFMALKAHTFNQPELIKDILNAPEARHAKAIGRTVKGLKGGKWDADDIALWDSVCYGHMVKCCLAKFSENIMEREFLLETGNRTIVEASPEDKIWGVGLHESDDRILDEANWEGRNLLGKALMEVRDFLAFTQMASFPMSSNV